MFESLILSTKNEHKVTEMSEKLSGLGIRAISFVELGDAPDVEEDGETLEENAIKKVKAFYEKYGKACLADDTGLMVDALGGAPGVHSARYCGVEHDFRGNNEKLLRELQGVPMENRTARFMTVLALADEKGTIRTVQGCVEGIIIEKLRGNQGFGYDPLFFIPELGCTMAELPLEEKNRISHRGRALDNLIEMLSKSKGCE